VFIFLNLISSILINLLYKYYAGEKENFISAEQLLWREFFYQLSYKNENFDRIDGNIMSFKIPWSYGSDHLAQKWENGQTGFPWIDACMRQLRQEGWMHHLCRNSVAVFLTRGQCFLSWTRGHRIFLRYLIDVILAIIRIFISIYLIK
jgi:deoxyribodipyrimidine photolyase